MSAILRRAVTTAMLTVCGASLASAAVFRVTNYNDSGPGSLRQAILDSNRTPGPNVIEIELAGASPRIIKVQGQFLPPLKGPVVVKVVGPSVPAPATPPADAAVDAGGRSGRGGGRGSAPVTPAQALEMVILDGSGLVKPRTPADCPGATAVYNAQTSAWEYSAPSGTGPNVRGYYGAGLTVHDSKDVEISGLEIRNFCIGVAAVRSSNVDIHDVKIVDSHGAAGVIFTGDDGSGGRTELSFNNRLTNSVLLDNGDGFEFTRGTHDSLLQGNVISLTQPLPENGNAVEFASSGDNNAVIGNTFSHYADTAVTVGGNNHTIRDNRFVKNEGNALRASGANLLIVGNTFVDNGGSAMSVSGSGTVVVDNVITGNSGPGVVIGSPAVRVTRNSIYNNSHLGIDADAGNGRGGARGAVPAASRGNAAADNNAPPTGRAAAEPVKLPEAPVIDGSSRWTADGIAIGGSVNGLPNRAYTVEIFVSHGPDRHSGDEKGWGEGEKYLATAAAKTDASGKGVFAVALRLTDPFGDGQTAGYVAATSTDSDGSTSRFGRAVLLGVLKR
jgi:3-dehydroshikimate dehydratase